MTITQKIEIYLKIENVSKSELAKRLNITPQAVTKILKKDDLKVSTLERIAHAINIEAKAFFENSVDL